MAKRSALVPLLVLLAGCLLLLARTLRETRRMQRAKVAFEQRLPHPGPTAGEEAAVKAQSGEPVVRVRIRPRPWGAGDGRWVWVRVGEDRAWDLPLPEKGADDAALAAWEARVAPILEDVRQALASARAGFPDDVEVLGEIQTRDDAKPGGVPPELVTRLLDLFVAAGYEDVSIEGRASPVEAER